MLKIDQSFIRELIHDQDSAAIVKTIIGLGHNMGLQIIAEGVESKEQLTQLQAMHCDRIQGYYFSRPLAVGDFEIFMKNSNILIERAIN